MSWIHSDAGYELLSNRDEKLTRAPALGPRILERDGLRIVAPVDGDFGGTWVGANEFGVTMSLLNGAASACGRRSRGLLVLNLLSSASLAEASERLVACDLSQYAPFTLAALEPVGRAEVFEWDGSELGVSGRPHAPLVSSSFDQLGVERKRRREYRRLARAGCGLDAFHRSHADAPSAYSPCMHRSDAETVSFSRVRVTERQVDFYYTPAAPCRSVPGETVMLCRKFS